MIPVAKVARPSGYANIKAGGDNWLRANPKAKRPKDLWSPFLPELAEGFAHLCGYAAMLDPTGGTVDHYLSWKNRPDLAYEWSNFRFVSHILNSSKKTADATVLDPYLVKSGWFEVILPSLQMRVTSKVPAAFKAIAEFTLKRLKLGDGEKVIRWRRHYYARYEAGQLALDGLRVFAPLVAEAAERASKVSKAKLTKQNLTKMKGPKAKPQRPIDPTSSKAKGSKRATK
ncbi:MAG: hypothetical protein KBG28_07115 [Kofleriaceae bacterium]|nr:hypothetical protein [Kofleriaceae bacterium]